MKRILKILGLAKIRVVLDTNVLVAAHFNPGSASNTILELCQRKKLVLVLTSHILKEFSLILRNISARKSFRKKMDKIIFQAILAKKAPRVNMVCEDPEDNKFLSCALAGKADYIITSDRHLLVLRKFRGIKIVKPVQFLKVEGK
ncbi:MAG TPA: putative toxin-antitoxin system toxin component, PIN family [bacterium]|nr:putative toxin-antitoxin system toxin component, PIN family [bacterium]